MIILLILIVLTIVLSSLGVENVKDLNQLAVVLDNNIKLLTDILNTPKEKENAEVDHYYYHYHYYYHNYHYHYYHYYHHNHHNHHHDHHHNHQSILSLLLSSSLS